MKEFIIYKTFKIQYINHPRFGIKHQYVAEDLDYGEAMLHFMDGHPMVITRDRDLKIPAGEY
jgi:hypothetical protein